MAEIPTEPYTEFSTPTKIQQPYGRSSHVEFDLRDIKKSIIKYKDMEYQLIPVEIEKQAEIGLVIGQIEGEHWLFIDEILPNGMIDMHGVLNEGDYLIQVGSYSLVGVNVAIALLIIERAYHEGQKAVSFVAARRQKSTVTLKSAMRKVQQDNQKRPQSHVSFVGYGSVEEKGDDNADEQDQVKDTKL